MEYTSKQLNYFRICYIAFNLVPKGLRKVFKQEWNFLYMTTPFGEWKDTPQNGHDFYNNETRRSHTKNARYLRTIQKGNTAEWDCSCLFFALLFSDSIGTPLRATIRKEVDDLRQVRNDIAHINEAELTDVEFQNYVARVLAAFSSLKLSINETEDVKNQTSFPTAEVNSLKMQADKLKADLKAKDDAVKNLSSELQLTQNTLQSKQEEVETLTQEINSKVKSFCNLTFKPSHQIIRRSRDVTRIMTKMDELHNESKGAVSTIYLSGIPGCGKSQIARQLGQEVFDKRLRKGEGLTFVATLNAETLDSLADSYFSLARYLVITEYALTNLATTAKGNPSETIQHLKSFIYPKMKQFSYWLLIADNVVDLSLVRGDLPPTGDEEWGHGQVIITTQDSSSIPYNAPHTYHESLSKGMHPDDAEDLLREVSQISNHEQAEKVAEVLEYQPLALAAAAVYIQTVVSNGSPNYGWTKYLETFNSGQREAREQLFAKKNMAYPKTTTTAIKMALTRVLETEEVLCEVLCLLSLCTSDSLPIEAAVDFVKFRTTEQREELIRAKILKSILITCLYEDDGTPTYLRVHNVVHEVLKSVRRSVLDLTQNAESIAVAVKIFHSLIENNKNLLPASKQGCGKLRIIVSHCKELFQFISTNMAHKEFMINKFSPIITPSTLVSWLSLTTEVCLRQSNLSDADFFSTLSSYFITDLKDTRDDKLLTAKHFQEHGKVHLAKGEHNQAKEYHKKSLVIRKEICGELHGDVAESYNNLAIVYTGLRKYKQAKNYLEESLAIRIKIYGEQDGNVAQSYENLANVYSDLEKYNQAKEYYEKSLAIKKKIYGEHHGDVATSYNNLGTFYGDLGQYNQAKEYHEKSLAIRKEIYGEEHTSVAMSYFNLGHTYGNLSEYHLSLQCYEKALNIYKKVYGEHHADVERTLNNLRFVEGQRRKLNQARSQICIVS